MAYEYKMIQIPPDIRVRDSSSTGRDAADYLEGVIKRHAVDGWEFYRVDPIALLVEPGCLGRFLGKGAVRQLFYVISFRRNLSDTAPAQTYTQQTYPEQSAVKFKSAPAFEGRLGEMLYEVKTTNSSTLFNKPTGRSSDAVARVGRGIYFKVYREEGNYLLVSDNYQTGYILRSDVVEVMA